MLPVKSNGKIAKAIGERRQMDVAGEHAEWHWKNHKEQGNREIQNTPLVQVRDELIFQVVQLTSQQAIKERDYS